jgi:hypothetical protein
LRHVTGVSFSEACVRWPQPDPSCTMVDLPKGCVARPLDAVRAKPDRICPLVCGKGQRVTGDRCVQIVCESNFVLDSEGRCRKRPDLPARPKAVSRREAAPHAPSAPAGGAVRNATTSAENNIANDAAWRRAHHPDGPRIARPVGLTYTASSYFPFPRQPPLGPT